eukprot:38047-Rhodomonas_salina.1
MSPATVVVTSLLVRRVKLTLLWTTIAMATPGGAQNSARVAFVSIMNSSTREGTIGATNTRARLNTSASIAFVSLLLCRLACFCGMRWGNSAGKSVGCCGSETVAGAQI